MQKDEAVILVDHSLTDTRKELSFTYYSQILKKNNLIEDKGIHYDDAYFNRPADRYDHELAIFSLAASMAGFNAVPESGEESNKYSAEIAGRSIKQLLLDVEFDEATIDISSYDGKPSMGGVGVAFASKPGWDDTTLIAVVLRGCGYEREWVGNFIMSEDSVDHSGFQKSADLVIDKLKSYIEAHDLKGELKIWITGYSRGAAVVNLAAVDLIDGALNKSGGDIEVSPKNIYAYTFGSANSTRSELTDDPKYAQIFNVINPIDPVSKLPSGGRWGFKKYGTVLALPSKETTPGDFYAHTEALMLAHFNDMTKNSTAEIPQIEAQVDRLDRIFEIVGYLIHGDRGEMAQENPDDPTVDYSPCPLPKILGDLYESLYLEDVSSFLELKTYLFPSALIQDSLELFFKAENAHYPEWCLSWMLAIEGQERFLDAPYRRLSLACPVDIEIHDREGRPVAKVVNDSFVDIPGQEVSGYVLEKADGENEKIILLPGEEEYKVTIRGTQNGSMTFELVEVDLETGEKTDVLIYEDLVIGEGDLYFGYLESVEDGDPRYSLVDSIGNDVSPTAR